jgi:hypothetical protein
MIVNLLFSWNVVGYGHEENAGKNHSYEFASMLSDIHLERSPPRQVERHGFTLPLRRRT